MAYAFDYAARSVVGLVRSSNQDSAYASPNLLVVADGMGGHAGGDVASTIAIEILKHLDHPGHTPKTALDDLENALDHSQLALIRASDTAPQLQGLGTTVVCLLRTDTTLVMAHMGDSRAYLLRNGQLTQVTVDHTFVQHLVDIGRITPEEAINHPQRNVVMRVLSDFDLDLHPDVSVREAKTGDRWLLCSDGLSGYLTEEELTSILLGVRDPDLAADALINQALKNQSTDNVTCLVADIVDPAVHFGSGINSSGDPAATVKLQRPIPQTQIVGAAANGGPLPDLVAAVVAGDDWDDADDDAEPMSDQDFAEHGLNYRSQADDIPTNPVPVVNAATATTQVTAWGEPVPAAVDPAVTETETGAAAGVLQPARVDPLYLHADDDPGARTAPKHRPWTIAAVFIGLAALLMFGLYRGYVWTQNQYFVGIHDNQVAVFRGISQDIGPLRLNHPILVFDVETEHFPSLFIGRLTDTIPATSYDDAIDRAERLIIDARTQGPGNSNDPGRPNLTRPALPEQSG